MDDALEKLIASGESGTIEFKESFGKAAIETLAAFANSEGGYLCVGVNDMGDLNGARFSEGQVKDWLNQFNV